MGRWFLTSNHVHRSRYRDYHLLEFITFLKDFFAFLSFLLVSRSTSLALDFFTQSDVDLPQTSLYLLTKSL